MGPSFFSDPIDDDELESRNVTFWEAMLDHIRRDGFQRPPRCVLDVGCHRGGLLARIAALWRPDRLIGIEPLDVARARAKLRIASLAQSVDLFPPHGWGRVPQSSVDLIVSHEVLFLLPDLEEFVAHMARALAPGARAYIAAGCHAENPVWPTWRSELERQGQKTFTHEPISLMQLAGRYKLLPSVRPLRESGWATHDPTDSPFTFPSIAALLDHQFRHKLLFRLTRT